MRLVIDFFCLYEAKTDFNLLLSEMDSKYFLPSYPSPPNVISERTNRSSCSQMFFKIGVFKNIANVTEKRLCGISFSGLPLY